MLSKLAQDDTKDKQEFSPTNEYRAAFNNIRTTLSSASILGHSCFNNPESPFILDCDWSATNQAIGAGLSQA